MPVTVDSSVLIGMVRIGRLELLRKLYGHVVIPGAAHHEVVIEGRRLRKAGVREIEKAMQSGWIRVSTLTTSQSDRAEVYRAGGELGQGETEAIVLARSRKMPLILDDAYARKLADTAGLEFTGTAAVLLEAHLRGLLSKKEFLESLSELGKVMWLSPEVLATLMRLAEETGE